MLIHLKQNIPLKFCEKFFLMAPLARNSRSWCPFGFSTSPSPPLANNEANPYVFKRSKLNLLYGACSEGVGIDIGEYFNQKTSKASTG